MYWGINDVWVEWAMLVDKKFLFKPILLFSSSQCESLKIQGGEGKALVMRWAKSAPSPLTLIKLGVKKVYLLNILFKVNKLHGGRGEGTSNEVGIICPLPTHPD